MFELFLAIVGGITGVYSLMKEIIIPLVDVYIVRKNSFDFLGVWYSGFEPRDRALKPPGEWITESVEIKKRWTGAIVITTKQNNFNFDYECVARLKRRKGINYLVGNWESRDKKMQRHGKVLLTLLPSGILMGSYTGPNQLGTWITGGWVLARDQYGMTLGTLLYLYGNISEEHMKSLDRLKGKPVVITPKAPETE